MESLEDIAALIHNCVDCTLSLSRTRAVPGEGATKVDLMLIGEGPGFYEDREGKPFVGPAGRFLEELLEGIGVSRRDVFITNMVKCRPPNNRDPLPEEISSCSKYLDNQIRLLAPKVIVTLGRFSLAKFFPGETIGKAHGKARLVGDTIVYPVMHPAAALRRNEFRRVIQDDFKAIPQLIKSAAGKDSKNNLSDHQMNMF